MSASSAVNACTVGDTIHDFGCVHSCLFTSHWNGKKWERLGTPAGILAGDNPDAGGASVAAISTPVHRGGPLTQGSRIQEKTA